MSIEDEINQVAEEADNDPLNAIRSCLANAEEMVAKGYTLDSFISALHWTIPATSEDSKTLDWELRQSSGSDVLQLGLAKLLYSNIEHGEIERLERRDG